MKTLLEQREQLNLVVDVWGENGIGFPHARRPPKTSELIFSFQGGTPYYYVWREYRLSEQRQRRKWLLWESVEGENTDVVCTDWLVPACCDAKGISAKEAACHLLLAVWEQHREWGYDGPNCMDADEIDAYGLLSDLEVKLMLEIVWPSLAVEEKTEG